VLEEELALLEVLVEDLIVNVPVVQALVVSRIVLNLIMQLHANNIQCVIGNVILPHHYHPNLLVVKDVCNHIHQGDRQVLRGELEEDQGTTGEDSGGRTNKN
jgi:hypothetical protein